MPVIAYFAGGIPDMVTHGETGLLYRFEEVEIPAMHIRSIFSYDNLTFKLSSNGIIVAEERHNRLINLNNTLEIYQEIIAK